MDTNAQLWYISNSEGREDSWFIPTKLATNLSISLSDASSRKQGYVVVETNFRLYAYSTSKLHCEILKLFARVEYQLPNLIVGSITKENLNKAFLNGITADQIVSFLQQNAHPRVADRVPSVPKNVTDQIRLCESDLNRVEMEPAHCFDDFPSTSRGYVVVETNFRLYAYSTSKLHCEILKLFARVEYQLPNLIVGSITKENLNKAFLNGITADQIVSFLQQNAHPCVADRVPSVPENVTDQIRLWESDLNRVEMEPAHCFVSIKGCV